MTFALTRKIIAVAAIAAFSQFAVADNASAFREIADIVASINHFPSDADKAALMAISSDDSLAGPLREMATAVSNISHSATAEGKAAMAEVIANAQVPDNPKVLAGIIVELNHMPSADAKATIAAMF